MSERKTEKRRDSETVVRPKKKIMPIATSPVNVKSPPPELNMPSPIISATSRSLVKKSESRVRFLDEKTETAKASPTKPPKSPKYARSYS